MATRIPCRVPSSHHAGQRGQGPHELRPPHLEDRAELRRLDQADRIHDDHGRERGFRHQPDEGSQQQHRHQRGARPRQAPPAACARPPAGSPRSAWCHRRPAWRRETRRPHSQHRSPAARGSPAARLAALGERAPGRNRFGEAHQRDAQGGRPELGRSARGPAGVKDGKPVGTWPTVATPYACKPNRLTAGDPAGHRDQRRWRSRNKVLDRHQNPHHRRPPRPQSPSRHLECPARWPGHCERTTLCGNGCPAASGLDRAR